MANTLYTPFLLPVKFHEQTPVEVVQYNSKFMDAVAYYQTIESWQERQPYYQPWQTSDTIKLQFISNYAPIAVKLIGEFSMVHFSENMAQIRENSYDTGMYIYEISIPLAAIPEGWYYLLVECGNPSVLSLVSEPLCIKESHPNSLLLEFSNYRYFGDIVFETGFSPSIRVLGKVRFKTPASKDTFFEDQVLNMTLLNSVPFRLYELILGDSTGIPDYLIDKLNRILGCSSLLIDGIAFTKQEGAKLEEKEIDDYPLRGWSVELREKLNRHSRFYSNDAAQDQVAAVVLNVDSKGFGNDQGGTIYAVTDIN
jgi:hypothetical protein